jgi:hypothetical protein
MTGVALFSLLEREGAREAAFEVLVRVAVADDELHDDELLLLQQSFPREAPEALRHRAMALRGQPLRADALQASVPDAADRRALLALAARMAWTDRVVTDGERALLGQIASAFGFAASAVDQAFEDATGVSTGVAPTRSVRELVAGLRWGDCVVSTGTPRSGLGRRLPAGEVPVCVVSVRGLEQIVLTESGFLAGFREGDVWVRWSDVAAWSRVPVFGASVRVDLVDGHQLHLGAMELWPFAAALDAVCAA